MQKRLIKAIGMATVNKVERKPIKLYFALLNHGWLRREFASKQLPEMNKTPGVDLRWEDPNLTWGHPIYSNRNKIVKRFLQTDCDFLMMQDDDILPLHNPAELVFADKDIIGSPAKVRTDHGTLDWVAYVHHQKLDGYVTANFTGVPADVDLLPVDIVGTGLILIKRSVLEHPDMRGAFTVENDADGVCEWGTDFAFCKRARKAGFEVYTTPYRVCEHMKEVGLLDVSGYEDSDTYDNSNTRYMLAWGGWAIQMKDWKFLKQIMEQFGVKRVLEFGAGLSSLLMSEKAEVVTYETREDWAKGIKEKANGNALQTVLWDGVNYPDLIKQRGPYDMAFIDGPPGKSGGGIGRAKAYEVAVDVAPPLIITHDSGRADEQKLAKKYLCEKYGLVGKNGHHQQRCELWQRKDLCGV